jgi:hypothetical protein
MIRILLKLHLSPRKSRMMHQLPRAQHNAVMAWTMMGMASWITTLIRQLAIPAAPALQIPTNKEGSSWTNSTKP